MARAPSKSTFTASERTESQVRLRVLSDRGWVGDRADCIGDVGTDAHDSAAVLADGFRRNCGSQPPFSAAQRLALGAADGTGTSAESQGVTTVTSETRSRKRHMIASSDSMRLSEEPKDPRK